MIKDRDERNKYMRKYHLARYYRLKKDAIDKLGGKCNQCGSTKNLEFDHVDPKNKTIEISRLFSVSLKDLAKELKKCQILCFSCHQIKSILERGQKPARGTHGTLSSYRYCKCNLCREAKSNHNKIYKLTVSPK